MPSPRTLTSLLLAMTVAGACGEREPAPPTARRAPLRSLPASSLAPGPLPPDALPPLRQVRVMHSPAPVARGRFGDTVAIDGDTLVAVASLESRARVVYLYDLTAPERAPQRLEGGAEPFAGAAVFGAAIAIDGDVMAIGAPGASSRMVAGSVHVFRRSPDGTWARETVIGEVAPRSLFGAALALDGDLLLVGAPLERPRGAVHVFVRSDGSWSRTASITSSGELPGEYGGTLALARDVLAVGAMYEWGRTSSGIQRSVGAVYLHARRGSAFDASVAVRPPSFDSAVTFGGSIAIDGSTLVVGDYRNLDAGREAGAVHLYTRRGTAVEHVQTITPERRVPHEAFGASVVLAGATALVAAPLVITSGYSAQRHEPSIRRFDRRGSQWTAGEVLRPDLADVRFFASPVVRSGRWVAAGSIWANAPGPGGAPIVSAGAVYLYEAREP